MVDMVLMDQKAGTEKQMKRLFFIAITTALLFPNPSQSETNHFGAGGVFELDLGDSEIVKMIDSAKSYWQNKS